MNLEEILEQLIASCSCDACHRYRRAFAARAGFYAAKIEESIKGGARR